jgi:virginiamycin B lyase
MRSPIIAAGGGPPNTDTPGLIGRMTVDGKATEFAPPTPPAPRPPAQPRDIVAGPDGALWFDTGMANGVAAGNSWIGRITTSGQASVVYAPDPAALVSIAAIAVGPDHAVWFTQSSSDANGGGVPVVPPGGSPVVPPPGGPPQQSGAVGRLAPAGAARLFPIPSTLGASPGAITAGPDGNLWFAAPTGKVARITAGGQITAFSLPDSLAEPGAMAGGPGAAVWIAQSYGDVDLVDGLIWGPKIGRVGV